MKSKDTLLHQWSNVHVYSLYTYLLHFLILIVLICVIVIDVGYGFTISTAFE
jgi:hypothetical protein